VFHVKHEGWPSWLSPEGAELLERYTSILLDQALPRGWIARADREVVRERHVLDALRGVSGLPAEAGRAVDLGSGAGLPGIPIAVARPDLEVVLAESRRARAAFLELAVAELALPRASVFVGRVEDLVDAFDVALARGFAPPGRTWSIAQRLLTPDGCLLYWAGASFDPARDLPGGVRAAALREPGLESEGSVVIMTRQ
jgi:16S rRNA (guanine527-N7)-methyltransferase